MPQKDKTKNVIVKKEKTDQYLESQKRGPYYTELLQNIVENNNEMQRLKKTFFNAALGLLFTIALGVMTVLIVLARKDGTSINDIVIAASSFGSLLSAVIVIPKIMAKHIFPEDSEKERFKFVNDMRKVDQINLPDPPKEFNKSNKKYLVDLNAVKRKHISKK